ncbi:MAG: PKD domain-containing protein, partial [Solirubrobacterales bacterium]|nr:PKD domain-containing protein [Solirubrobacterales bacterium]
NQAIHGHHYYLQQEWSNDNGGCASHAKADRVSFSTRHGKTHRKIRFAGHAHDPHGRIVIYTWFFGDGKVGHRRVAKHQYRRRGTYRVTLRVTDSSGNWTFSVGDVRLSS